jgi:ABC-type multidrug transport system ATPase subunit
VLSTHRPDEVRQLADRVLVLDKGTLVAVGHPKELASLLQERVTLKLLVPEPPARHCAQRPQSGTHPNARPRRHPHRRL